MTIFFMLSGYLITTLMRSEHERRGSIDFPAFYLRRFLRLIAIAATLLLGVGGAFSGTGICAVLFYFSNY